MARLLLFYKHVLCILFQENLTLTYNDCAAESGSGMYDRMKAVLADGIDKGRFYMFDDASSKLLQELEQIKVSCNMFDDASRKLLQELEQIKVSCNMFDDASRKLLQELEQIKVSCNMFDDATHKLLQELEH
jgi:hypothetical protein